MCTVHGETEGIPQHATDGAFVPDGTFFCLPKIHTDRLLATWQTNVFELLVAAGKVDQQTVDQMPSWPHSGFSVDNSVYLSPGDTAGLPCSVRA